MLLVGKHICIGTQSGTVLAMPQASAQRGSTDFAVDLKPTAGMGRLLTSFFARCCPCNSMQLQGHHSCVSCEDNGGSLSLCSCAENACKLRMHNHVAEEGIEVPPSSSLG